MQHTIEVNTQKHERDEIERRVRPNIKKPDLNSLKRYALEQQALHFIRLDEIHHANAHSKMRASIAKRYYDISQKLSAISQDGFTRERFIMKIQDSTDKVNQALEDLIREEGIVESGAYQNQD